MYTFTEWLVESANYAKNMQNVHRMVGNSENPLETANALASVWSYHSKRDNVLEIAEIEKMMSEKGMTPLYKKNQIVPFDGRFMECYTGVSDDQPVKVILKGWMHTSDVYKPIVRAIVEIA